MNWVLDDHKELWLSLLGMLMCEYRWERFKDACYVLNFFEIHTEIISNIKMSGFT